MAYRRPRTSPNLIRTLFARVDVRVKKNPVEPVGLSHDGAFPPPTWPDPTHPFLGLLLLPAPAKRFVELHKALLLVAAVLDQRQLAAAQQPLFAMTSYIVAAAPPVA